MATVALTVDQAVDIPNAKVLTTVQKVTDSMSQNRAEGFRKFCSDQDLPLSSQSDIEQAVVEFAKARQTSLFHGRHNNFVITTTNGLVTTVRGVITTPQRIKQP